MRHSFKFYLLFILIFSCVNKEKPNKENRKSTLPEPDIIKRLTTEKKEIDSLFNVEGVKVTTYVLLKEDEPPVQMKYDDTLENAITYYDVQQDNTGKIQSITEYPISQSGDWNAELTHYFDKYERTFVYESQVNSFYNKCGVAPTFTTTTIYYNELFSVVDTMKILLDKTKKKLDIDSCFTYPIFTPEVFKTAKDLLASKKIELK